MRKIVKKFEKNLGKTFKLEKNFRKIPQFKENLGKFSEARKKVRNISWKIIELKKNAEENSKNILEFQKKFLKI